MKHVAGVQTGSTKTNNPMPDKTSAYIENET